MKANTSVYFTFFIISDFFSKSQYTSILESNNLVTFLKFSSNSSTSFSLSSSSLTPSSDIWRKREESRQSEVLL